MRFNYLSLFMLPVCDFARCNYGIVLGLGFSISSSSSPPLTPTLSLSSTPYANTSRFVYAHEESMCSFDPNLAFAVGVKNVSGLVVVDKQSEQTYKVQPFRDGLPLCSDPAYVVGALGSSCYDDDDLLTSTPKPISPMP